MNNILNKKIILLIVEGSTDERILSSVTDKMKTKYNKIEFELIRGDIFGQNGNEGAKSLIAKPIRKYLETSKLLVSQIAFVGYLVDVDGIYVQEEDILVDNTKDKDYFEYDGAEKKIIFGSESKMKQIKKNWKKRVNRLNQLQHNDLSVKISNTFEKEKNIRIPVQVYFNNISLEHVLVNEIIRNESSRKEKIAKDFHTQMSDSKITYEKAKDFFKKKVPVLCQDNKTSWDNVKTNNWVPSSSIYFLLCELEDIISKIE